MDDPDVFDLLCKILADEFGADSSRLTPKTELISLQLDQEEYHRLYEQMAEATGVDLNAVVHSMPLYSIDESETVMGSLRNLAPFNSDAKQYLESCDVRTDKETLGSIADSFARGEYVASGLYFDPIFPARSKRYVISWTLGIVVVLLIIGPLWWAVRPCGPFKPGCSAGPLWVYLKALIYTVPATVLLLGLAFAPGMIALRARRKRRARRATG
ncbi:hypothetical protein [Yoonia sp. I 8.24]|uniref:hypothetical protein n=1 Tax=Yoonia sp. I 8.24 TaxID=1537229 RepID=UPI001EE13CFE|nr:hypothetical protein [Yoonia sp. I 8.24]MCG3266242.1 hypothetical protein [Yoonia sp. I 8.24]